MKKILYILITLAIICLLGIRALKTFVYPVKYFDVIKEEAINNNIDPYLILSIIKTESSFKADATSNKNAKEVNNKISGTYIEDESDIDIYDVSTNISLGCNYFASLVDRYNGNYYLAICAYNAGLGNVDKWISEGVIPSNLDSYNDTSIPFNETKYYLKKVMTTYKMYKILYR